MKRIFFVIILFVVGISSTTCKKISRYPFNLYGIWITHDAFCANFIEINRSGFGHYGTKSLNKGCGGREWKGRVKYNSKYLYIGHTTLEIIQRPEIYNGNDSVNWDDNYTEKKYKKLATMKLKSSFFHGYDKQFYYKIIDY